MLYRPCLSVPVLLAGELGGGGGSVRGRAAEQGLGGVKGRAGEEDRVYLVVAEAGSKVLRLYRQLHRVHQVNYTFLATHHLFMAGNILLPRKLCLTDNRDRNLVSVRHLAFSAGQIATLDGRS